MQKWNNNVNVSQWECKKHCTCNKDYSLNPSTCICQYSKYLKQIFDD